MTLRLSLLVVILLLNGCTGLLFQPMKPLIRTPASIGLEYQDVNFVSADGTSLHGWFLPAKGGMKMARGSILLLHGNAENISTHIGSVYWLPPRGFNVFLFDYRGYGQSQGSPSLQGAMHDVAAALDWLLRKPALANTPIAVLGQSLGGAMGSYVFAHNGQASAIRALILDSVFSDYRQIAREKLASFWLTWPLQYPLSWLINDDYSPLDAIGLYSPTPVLIIQGEADTIVPPHHAQQLFAHTKPPKALWLIPGAKHISALNQPMVRDRLVDYLSDLFGYSHTKNHEKTLP